MTKVYLACYYGRASRVSHRLFDKITKFFTRGKFSHCEIAIHLHGDKYQCYSSSYRDGGVRTKTMQLDPTKWQLIPIHVSDTQIKRYFGATRGSGYDLLGALGVVAGFREHKSKYFCSEWCYNAIFGSQDGWQFSPVQLAEIVNHLSYFDDDC